MQAELLEKKTQTQLMLKKTDHTFVNTLRRLIVEEVPTMAVDVVEFRKNSSVIYDEMLAHRIGLIPLKTDLESYNIPEECTCKAEGCAKCQVKLTLKAKGPKTVYSSDFQSNDPKIIPVIKDIPVVTLLKDQELELEATATLGKGKNHAKYSPGLAFYRDVASINIKNPKNADTIEKRCPTKVFESKSGKLKVKDLNACILCQECAELSEGEITVVPTSTDFIFTFESWGQHEDKDVIQAAVKELNKKLDDFSKKLSTI